MTVQGKKVGRSRAASVAGLVAWVSVVSGLVGCVGGTRPAPDERPASASHAPVSRAPAARSVVLVSIDALSVQAVRRLGRSGTPHLHRMLADGVGTLNARSAPEQTVTLPNHVGMVTGRPVDPSEGGHGVRWNTERGGDTARTAAGEPVESVFSLVAGAGGRSALFSGKQKFDVIADSWPAALVETIEPDERRLVLAAKDRFRTDRPDFMMVHLMAPDEAGHAHGGLSGPYLQAVRRADADLGVLLDEIDRLRAWSTTTVVLTADHGVTRGQDRHDARTPANATVPLVALGADVGTGDLYRLNPDFRDPGDRLAGRDGPQPIRNLDVANLTTHLLGLGRIPGSADRPVLRVAR